MPGPLYQPDGCFNHPKDNTGQQAAQMLQKQTVSLFEPNQSGIKITKTSEICFIL